MFITFYARAIRDGNALMNYLKLELDVLILVFFLIR